jgi:hypothetical protein
MDELLIGPTQVGRELGLVRLLPLKKMDLKVDEKDSD